MKKICLSLFMLSATLSFAANTVSSVKMQAAASIESAFMPSASVLTVQPDVTNVPWNDLDVSITNQWQVIIKSKNPYNVQQISLTINGTTLTNNVNIQLKPNAASTYFFYDVKLDPIIKSLVGGKKFIGVYSKVSGNDFAGFNNFQYQKAKLTISWIDGSGNYYQSSNNFMLVTAL